MTLATMTPLRIDHVRIRNAGDAVVERYLAVRVLDSGPASVPVSQELLDAGGAVVVDDHDEPDIASALVGGGEAGQVGLLLLARDAPGGEEVEHHPPVASLLREENADGVTDGPAIAGAGWPMSGVWTGRIAAGGWTARTTTSTTATMPTPPAVHRVRCRRHHDRDAGSVLSAGLSPFGFPRTVTELVPSRLDRGYGRVRVVEGVGDDVADVDDPLANQAALRVEPYGAQIGSPGR